VTRSLSRKGAAWRLFCCLLAASPAARAAPACTLPAFDETDLEVRHVHDGDTLKLADGRKIRLIGIDTPELGQHGEADEAFAIEARDTLRRAIAAAGDHVALAFGPERRDRYGRTLAHVFTGGDNLNQQLLDQGLAVAITYPPNDRLSDCYHAHDRAAAAAGRGLWGARQGQLVQASQLLRNSEGFRLIDATIDEVEFKPNGAWLRAQPLQVFIPAADLDRFDRDWLRGLSGQRVLLRGEQRRDRYRPADRRFMMLRHPSAITLHTAAGH
jgi:endonuclease YncB( thermonuclease family)